MHFVSGGYVFVRAAPRPSYGEASVLPASICTPTSCLCELYPEYWAISWCQEPQEKIDACLAQLGLSAADLAPLQAWVEGELESGGVGFPGVLLRREVAAEFAARFVRAGPEIKLLGIGLPESYVSEFLIEARPGEGEGAPGVYQAIESRAPLADGGNSLGFEPLGYDHGAFHSFICNGLEREYASKLELTLNAHGRFNDLDACERAVEYTRLATTGAEPALWQPWLVTEFSRTIV